MSPAAAARHLTAFTDQFTDGRRGYAAVRCKGNKKQKGKVLGKADVIARVSYLDPRPRTDEIFVNFRAPDNRVNPS